MAGDFSKPIITDNYALVLQAVREVMADMAKGLDPALALGTTNIPANAIRWTSAGAKWQKFNGFTWGDLSVNYAISITGSAARWSTGRTIQLTGAVYGTSAAWDGSGNISVATEYSTVPAVNGGTGLTAYSIGDLIYASGAAALSRLAGVAAGNALLSGGIGGAPSWGKIGLTTHVNGTLPVANGGTGNTSNTSAACSGTSEYATRWWAESNVGSYYQACNWDGSYWHITSNHGSPVRVGFADYATSAGTAIDQPARNAAAAAQDTANSAWNARTLIYFSQFYAIPAGNTELVWQHGLGVTPEWYQVYLYCNIANNGYAQGDLIPIGNFVDGDGSRTYTSWVNYQNIGVMATNWSFKSRTTMGITFPAPGYWYVIFRAGV